MLSGACCNDNKTAFALNALNRNRFIGTKHKNLARQNVNNKRKYISVEKASKKFEFGVDGSIWISGCRHHCEVVAPPTCALYQQSIKTTPLTKNWKTSIRHKYRCKKKQQIALRYLASKKHERYEVLT